MKRKQLTRESVNSAAVIVMSTPSNCSSARTATKHAVTSLVYLCQSSATDVLMGARVLNVVV